MAREARQPEKLLLVSQLWAWQLNDVIITAVPKHQAPKHQAPKHQAPRHQAPPKGPVASIYARRHFKKLKQLDAKLVMAWILSETINLFDTPYVAGFREHVLYTFEKAVANTFDRIGTYVKENGMINIKIDEEQDLMHRIRDVRDELRMIKAVIIQQQDVWNDFTNDQKKVKSMSKRKISLDSNEDLKEVSLDGNEDPKETGNKNPKETGNKNSKETGNKDPKEIGNWWEGADSWQNLDSQTKIWLQRILQRPKHQLLQFLKRIDKIDADAQRGEEKISWLLDLNSKHAGLNESHNSLVLSRAVIGFTVITAIFTPLSFVVSLLALPVEWLRSFKTPQDNDKGIYSNGSIAGWLGELTSIKLILSNNLLTGIRIWGDHLPYYHDSHNFHRTSSDKALRRMEGCIIQCVSTIVHPKYENLR